MRDMHWRWIVLAVLFLVSASWRLGYLPGLLADEGSEGYNVFELLTTSPLKITGERSYISAWIDYVRVPFIGLLGYTPLGVRAPMFFASIGLFAIAGRVLTRWFGANQAVWITTALFFSPAYLLNQRLGWAITLLPFFAFALVYFLQKAPLHPVPLLAGLVAGSGLSTHLLFLPTLIAIVIVFLLWHVPKPSQLVAWWPALIGFWAGFAVQFAILRLWTEDQGNPTEVVATVAERFRGFPTLLPDIISGSIYSATYGSHWLTDWKFSLAMVIVGFAAVGLLVPPRRLLTLGIAAALVIHTAVLILMIEQFSPRYFVVFTLLVWLLAGKGVAAVAARLHHYFSAVHTAGPPIVAIGLLMLTFFSTVVPWTTTGGTTAPVEFGNRMISSASTVAVEPLLECLKNAGPVYSNNIQLVNRLTYLALESDQFFVVDDNKYARWVVVYRASGQPPGKNERCPELTNFRVVERKNS